MGEPPRPAQARGKQALQREESDEEETPPPDVHLMETKKPTKKVHKRQVQPQPTEDRLLADSRLSMASTVLRVAPRLYQDKQDTIKGVKEEKEGTDTNDSPHPPSSKRHSSPSPPPGGGVKQMQAAGIRQAVEPQGENLEGGDETQLVPPKVAKASTKRTSYGGTFDGKKFHKTAKDVEHMSEAEQRAILIDIDADQQKKKID